MFPDLSKLSEPEKLRKLMFNARRLGHDDYAFQIRMRLAELAGQAFSDPLEREFWTAVSFAEEGKTEASGKITKLAGARTKHKKYGVIRCLGDWAMEPNPTEGFASLVEHQRAELSGEAIVVRHADKFSVEAVASAAAKLEAHGISREQVA